MRLIDADALLEELKDSHFPGAPYIDAGISIAIGKVLGAPIIEERKWIPCSERLPEIGETVLWCNKHGSVFVSSITFKAEKCEYFTVGKHFDVIAWMPLPGPYKDGKHEDDYDYERASDMRDYCERYEPTYNPEDGSM